MEQGTRWQIEGPLIHGCDGHDRQLAMAGEHIVAPAEADGPRLSLPASWHIVPGFIDAHIHGARGADVMDATPAALAAIAGCLPAEGTTAFLATTMTGSAEAIEAALTNVAHFRPRPGQAEVLGIHLEGPFISPDKAGAQPVAHVVPPEIKQFQRWQQASGQQIRVVTLAPEQPGGTDLITWLTAQGIKASIGHSACNAAQAEAAIRAGAGRGTHLFNAMDGLHHRQPGAACALLNAEQTRCEIIADGLHVAPAMVALAHHVLGSRRLMAITDAMRAKGLGDGEHELGGQAVQVRNGQARLADGTLAGSVLHLDAAFRNLLAFTGCQWADAVAMSSTNAAHDLGVAHRKGHLDAGFDADLVVLDEQQQVRLTVCRGQVAHDPDGLMQGL